MRLPTVISWIRGNIVNRWAAWHQLTVIYIYTPLETWGVSYQGKTIIFTYWWWHMANTWGEGGGGAAARVNLTPINSSFSDYEAYTYMTSERSSWFPHCMLMRWVPPVIAKSVQWNQVGFTCLIVVCHILIVGQLHMLVAAIYSKLSLFIEMRCSIVFTDFTSLLHEHSLQDWGYMIRPIMSTQRKCNRFCAGWWVFPITPGNKVRYAHGCIPAHSYLPTLQQYIGMRVHILHCKRMCI